MAGIPSGITAMHGAGDRAYTMSRSAILMARISYAGPSGRLVAAAITRAKETSMQDFLVKSLLRFGNAYRRISPELPVESCVFQVVVGRWHGP